MSYPTLARLSQGSYASDELIPDLRRLIDTECKPFLKDWSGDHFMFRGISSKSTLNSLREHGYAIVAVRGNRSPLNTMLQVQKQVDNMFELEGFAARRSNSIFVTGDAWTASSYDDDEEARVIIPMGDYNFTWSEQVQDFTADFHHVTQADPEMDYLFNTCDPEFIYRLGYKRNDSIDLAIESGNEIMIQCDRVLVLNQKLAEQIFGAK